MIRIGIGQKIQNSKNKFKILFKTKIKGEKICNGNAVLLPFSFLCLNYIIYCFSPGGVLWTIGVSRGGGGGRSAYFPTRTVNKNNQEPTGTDKKLLLAHLTTK